MNNVHHHHFPALRTISGIFKVFSWIIGVITLVLIVVALIGSYQLPQLALFNKFVAAGIILLIGGFYALMLHAAGEIIMVWLTIEENTRKVA